MLYRIEFVKLFLKDGFHLLFIYLRPLFISTLNLVNILENTINAILLPLPDQQPAPTILNELSPHLHVPRLVWPVSSCGPRAVHDCYPILIPTCFLVQQCYQWGRCWVPDLLLCWYKRVGWCFLWVSAVIFR